MTASETGALPSQNLAELIDAGFIQGAKSENISPASLDLSVSEEIYEVRGLVLPKVGETIASLLSYMGAKKVSINNPLTCGHIYLARLNETLELPSTIYGYCNPKSSTGRLDVHVRVLADGVPRYDSVTPKGFSGSLWIAIHPKSFCIQIAKDIPLTQLRLFSGDTRLGESDLEIALKKFKLVWHEHKARPLEYSELLTNDQDGAILLTPMTREGCAGYVCVAEKESVLDMSKLKYYESKDFFEPIDSSNDQLLLERDKFYILSSAERVRIPPCLASEMVPMDERSGDFRSHYAGFLDPGWGWGNDGKECGRPFTLEVRPFEDLIVRQGQPIAKIRFELMAKEPSIHYDSKQSNYLVQMGPKLAKQFKS